MRDQACIASEEVYRRPSGLASCLQPLNRHTKWRYNNAPRKTQYEEE